MARLVNFGAFLAVIVLLSAAAHASLLPDDANAMDGWTGEQTFYKTDGIFTLHVTVQFAVYAPGQFAASFGVDPSAGTDYVYAYQVLNMLSPGSEEVSRLTVGLLPESGARNIGIITADPVAPDAIVPTSNRISGASARWSFDDPTIEYGEQSVLLFFTSPNPPRWLSGSVQDGGLADTQAAPSPNPVPEPATCALLAIGAAGWLIGRGRRFFRPRCL